MYREKPFRLFVMWKNFNLLPHPFDPYSLIYDKYEYSSIQYKMKGSRTEQSSNTMYTPAPKPVPGVVLHEPEYYLLLNDHNSGKYQWTRTFYLHARLHMCI